MTAQQATSELAFAMVQRDMAGVRDALARGANPDVLVQQNKGFRPLRAAEWAIQNFYPMEFLHALVEAGARLDDNGDHKKPTSLLGVAVRCANLSAASLLVERSEVDDSAWRAAAESSNVEMAVQVLLRKTTNLGDNHPALAMCAGPLGFRIVGLLHAKGMRWARYAASSACVAGMRSKMDLFLHVVNLAVRQDRQALVAAISKSGSSPLHRSSEKADIQRMIEHPFLAGYREHRDKAGHTPLHTHLRAGNMETAPVFMDAGCIPPPVLAGEDAQAYGLRILPKRHAKLADHPVMARAYALAQQAILSASAVAVSASRPGRRL